jgi:hypothetical protein
LLKNQTLWKVKKLILGLVVIALGFTCKGRKKKEAEKRLIHMLFMWTRKCSAADAQANWQVIETTY